MLEEIDDGAVKSALHSYANSKLGYYYRNNFLIADEKLIFLL